MEILVTRAVGRHLLAGLAVLLAGLAHAKEGDTFQPFVSYTRVWDDNLFRQAQNERAEQYGVLSAGVDVDWRPSRQQVQARAAKSLVRFDRYGYLDYDGSDYQLRWNWRLGNYWSGSIGATELVTQSSFSDLLGAQINNTVTRENRFASADWQFHPRWLVGVGASTVSSTNSTSERAPFDYDETAWTVSLGYRTPKGSALRLQGRRVDGEYPRRAVFFLDRAYTQNEINLIGDWVVSGKLTARGRLGYVQRQNDTVAERDFSGIAGRVTADYALTAKTRVNWSVYRELANSDDINASYQLSTGTSLAGIWQATSKLAMRANASWENRSFEGDTGQLPGWPRRDEEIVSGTLSLSYAPHRLATLDLGVQAGQRESNVPFYSGYDYRFRAVFASLRMDF